MEERKPKAKDDDAPEIDPAMTGRRPQDGGGPSASTIGNTGQRRENETDANRSGDGARKRAEEGL